MNFNSQKLKKLLQGDVLVREVGAKNPLEITWVEIRLSENSKIPYPLRTPPYAMLKGSAFRSICPPEKASFKIRYATFLKSDIDNDLDPCYDKVGSYINIPSLSDLESFLKKEGLDLENFIDSGVTNYPL